MNKVELERRKQATATIRLWKSETEDIAVGPNTNDIARHQHPLQPRRSLRISHRIHVMT